MARRHRGTVVTCLTPDSIDYALHLTLLTQWGVVNLWRWSGLPEGSMGIRIRMTKALVTIGGYYSGVLISSERAIAFDVRCPVPTLKKE